jgi:hypothetical protein
MASLVRGVTLQLGEWAHITSRLGSMKRHHRLECATTQASTYFHIVSATSGLSTHSHQAVNVTLRIEGKSYITIFEGLVSTKFHRITMGEGTSNSQSYHCNGLNNDANPCPGPTCTTALDDARTSTGLKIPYVA